MFVKLTLTLPAFAVSELLVNFSAPLGSAASLSVLAAPEDAGVLDAGGVDAGVELVVDAGGAEEAVELLLEPPHAASPTVSANAPSVTARYLCMVRFLSV
jgi:hypothetical protein